MKQYKYPITVHKYHPSLISSGKYRLGKALCVARVVEEQPIKNNYSQGKYSYLY